MTGFQLPFDCPGARVGWGMPWPLTQLLAACLGLAGGNGEWQTRGWHPQASLPSCPLFSESTLPRGEERLLASTTAQRHAMTPVPGLRSTARRVRFLGAGTPQLAGDSEGGTYCSSLTRSTRAHTHGILSKT